MNKKALVIFKNELNNHDKAWLRNAPSVDVVIAPKEIKQDVEASGRNWESLENQLRHGSIYEANDLLKELSLLKFEDGTRIAKSFKYKGYELWWIHYNALFLNFCLPFVTYKNLLLHLSNFKTIHFYQPPFEQPFKIFLESYGTSMVSHRGPGIKSPTFLPFGVLIQILLTVIFLPFNIFRGRKLLVFIGDRFDGDNDFDFRMKFIYQEIRKKKLPYIEVVRSLESWDTVLAHAWKRKRPVIYSAAVTFIGRFLSIISGGRAKAKKQFGSQVFAHVKNPEQKFKYLLATQYLLGVSEDIWSIRIMKWFTGWIGVKAALIPSATERNYHTVLGCKLSEVPIVGILHGFAANAYNVYDFTPHYDGKKSLSVDLYGVWSKWWKEYYLKHGAAFKEEQLIVSGPIRPLEKKYNARKKQSAASANEPIKVLFVPGELSNPEEIMPYIKRLMAEKDISFYLTFRPYRDRFENWLKENDPQVIETLGKDKILLGNIHDAIEQCDITVGSYSTAVLEALYHGKPIAFFATNKWGDYFELKGYDKNFTFYAESAEELIECIKNSKNVPEEMLKGLLNRFFGDPYKNGSAWMVGEAEKILHGSS